jgi:hypothetical protein
MEALHLNRLTVLGIRQEGVVTGRLHHRRAGRSRITMSVIRESRHDTGYLR